MGLWNEAGEELSNGKAVRVRTDPAGAREQSRSRTRKETEEKRKKTEERGC